MPQARAVLAPSIVARLAGQALNECRRRVQQDLRPPGQAEDPLYKARRPPHTGIGLLSPAQHKRLEALFANDNHAQVEVTWGAYQKITAAYHQPDKAKGKTLMRKLITAISCDIPAALSEVITLGRTLKKRAGDILAYFDYPQDQQRPHRTTQRTPRTHTRLSTGLSLHHPKPARSGRI